MGIFMGNKDSKNTKPERFGNLSEHGAMSSDFQWLDKSMIFIGTFCAIIHGAGMPILALLFGEMTNKFLMIQNITRTLSPETATTSSIFDSLPFDMYSEIKQFFLYYIYVGIMVFVVSYGQITCWEAIGERRTDKYRKAYFKSVLRREIAWYDEHQSGAVASRLTDDLNRFREGAGDNTALFIQYVATFVFGIVVGCLYSWKLTLVMTSLAPLFILTFTLMASYSRSGTEREQEKYAIAGGIAKETMSSMRTVLAFNGQKREIDRFERALEEGKRIGVTKQLVLNLGYGLTYFATYCSYGLGFWYGSKLIDQDQTFARGSAFTVFMAIVCSCTALGNALPHLITLAASKGASKEIMKCINNVPKIDPYSEGGLKPFPMHGCVEFVNLQFSYPVRKDIKVLKGINFKVMPGEKVALVGASGSSKSTIVNLLLRYYEPDKGKILLDGYDIRDLNVRFLRNIVGVVSQEPVLFDGSIEDNIRMGNPDLSMDQILEATKLANASNFIALLPKGLDTKVGEGGMQLSGGQKQRIAIARALVRNCKILLLDEATSALDTESESLVQQALDKAVKGRTTITIAHRLSTIRDSDEILILSHGDIVEQGTYHELMDHKQIFYKMVIAQQLDAINYDVSTKQNSQDTNTALANINSSTENYSTKAETESDLDHLVETDEDDDETKNDYHGAASIRRILFINPRLLCWSFAGLCVNCFMGTLLPAFALLYSQFFQIYSEDTEQLMADTAKWSPMFFIIGAVHALCIFLALTILVVVVGENITKDMRLQTFSKLLCQDATYFDDQANNSSSICTRLSTDAPDIKFVFSRIPVAVQGVVTVIGGILVAFIVEWRIAIIAAILVPMIAGAGYFQLQMQFKKKLTNITLLNEAGKISTEAIENIRTVQALTCEDTFSDRYSESLQLPLRKNLNMAHVYGLVFGLTESIVYFMYAIVFYVGAVFIDTAQITPLNIYRVFFEIVFCSTQFGKLISFVPDVVKGKLAAGILFYMIDEIPAINSCSEFGLKLDLKGHIEMKNVHFVYKTRPTVSVLQGLDISVNAGQKLALVGPSGCGKSTVISLLQRFYDVTEGKIKFDGCELNRLNIEYFRNQIGLVSQEPKLFDCTIWENIAYGLEDVITHQDIVSAAKLANIHQFILSLPLGYTTNVGEKGVQLSGGQKQRIAIARALVRNPKILLLDEATSALDTKSEKIVQEALDNVVKGRTCVIVSHRLSTVQDADCIAVMHEGKIVEKGTHQELSKIGGLYSKLCQMQRLGEE